MILKYLVRLGLKFLVHSFAAVLWYGMLLSGATFIIGLPVCSTTACVGWVAGWITMVFMGIVLLVAAWEWANK